MNADLQRVLIDIALWLYRGFFVPGDQLLAQLPGLYFAAHGRVVSGLLSAAIWSTAVMLIVMFCRFIGDMDRTLTAVIERLYTECRRALRVVARRLGIALRAYALERQARATRTEVSEQPALDALQLAVLRSLAGLPPAHLSTPNELAGALDMRLAAVEQVLAALKMLTLVERTFGAGDGEDGYRLTRAGEVLLAACSRAQPVKRPPAPQGAVRQKRMEPTLGSM